MKALVYEGAWQIPLRDIEQPEPGPTDATLTKGGDFVVLKNYATLLHDKQFLNSMLITAKYVLLNIPLQTVIAIGLAVLISHLTKSTFVRLVIFLPSQLLETLRQLIKNG